MKIFYNIGACFGTYENSANTVQTTSAASIVVSMQSNVNIKNTFSQNSLKLIKALKALEA